MTGRWVLVDGSNPNRCKECGEFFHGTAWMFVVGTTITLCLCTSCAAEVTGAA